MEKIRKVTLNQSKKFSKEIKDLAKKYKSLPDDFDVFCDDLKVDPKAHIAISWIGEWYTWEFYKVKKFVCQSINRNSRSSGIRIIYRYLEDGDTAELEFIQIDFVEIYHKNTKEEFDYDRLEQYRSQE